MAKQKEEKQGAEAKLAALEKEHGLHKAKIEKKDVVSTGSHTIDLATNLGGYPKGKIIEIWGQESAGKSTIVLLGIAQHQKEVPDRLAALIDFEYSFDEEYAKALGVDTDKLLIYQPDNQENGYNMILGLVKEELCSIIVIDSHTAAVPQKVVENGMGDATIGIQARNNSIFLSKIKGMLSNTRTTLIAVSQTRTNIGGMGDVNVPTGGNSFKFYADMRFKLWKSNDKAKELNKTTLEVVKNKCAKPWGKAEFDIFWGTGISNYREILDLAEKMEIVSRSGASYTYGEIKLGMGAEKAAQTLADNDELYNEIKNKVLNND